MKWLFNLVNRLKPEKLFFLNKNKDKVSLPYVNCNGHHSFNVLEVKDGNIIKCQRCGETMKVIQLQHSGEKLRIANPIKHGLAKKRKIMNFIVVQVDQDYEFVEGVRHIKSFSTKDEADKFVKEKKEENLTAWQARLDYIEQWVDALDLPETDYNGWKEYLVQYHPFGKIYVTPKYFKKNLKGYLRTHHSVTIEGYNPPLADPKYNGLHIIEIN